MSNGHNKVEPRTDSTKEIPRSQTPNGDTEPLGPNTVLVSVDNNKKAAVFYKTAIVTFDGQQIILNTGGWWTATTKKRMNLVSRKMELGYRVYQRAEDWFVEFEGQSFPFDTERIRLNLLTGDAMPLESTNDDNGEGR